MNTADKFGSESASFSKKIFGGRIGARVTMRDVGARRRRKRSHRLRAASTRSLIVTLVLNRTAPYRKEWLAINLAPLRGTGVDLRTGDKWAT